MAAINLAGYIEDGKVETVIAAPSIMSSRIGAIVSDPSSVVLAPTLLSSLTGIISRRLADTGTGSSDSSAAASKESWS